ncbi:MAG: hypothetical protein QM530_09175 [Phycisphaerales bacterium]|nr:hypothetical protein [Phycisphaerales bacterium]
MSKENNQIRTNFKEYTELKTKRKTVLSSPIDVKKVKERQPTLKFGNTAVVHQAIPKNLNFEVEVKIDHSKDFQFVPYEVFKIYNKYKV